MLTRILLTNSLVLLLAAAVVGLAGCGLGAAGTAVTGSVTLDGEPLESGRIVFEPQGAGKMAIGTIAQGTYQIAADQAPTPGTYLIRITAERPTGKNTAVVSRSLEDQAPAEQYEQYLPAKYNSRSELTLQIPQDSTGKHDFALTSS